MQQGRQSRHEILSPEQATNRIGDVLSGIRVPGLPYSVGKVSDDSVCDWTPLLLSCWTEQRDEAVTRLIRSVSLTWSVRQINSAYVSDRIMDVFLSSSGLHPELSRRIARLRFYIAGRMNKEGAGVFSGGLLDWLDSLQDYRGWSASGGRSSKLLLDQLDSLVIEVSSCFQNDSSEPLEAFCEQWKRDAEKRERQTERLRERLRETERGAARQRRAEHTARALVGRALQGRRLPEPVARFVMDIWFGLLKQVVWEEGTEGENWRHASKLLEWLVWIGDPALSDKDKNRLYTVGEQIGDRITDVWKRLNNQPLPEGSLSAIQSVMVDRLRGEQLELVPALPPADRFSWDSSWLAREAVPQSEIVEYELRWYVEGEGAKEQRRFFFGLLDDTQEVLWTNGAGVKLGLTGWKQFRAKLADGTLRPLPPLKPFGEVLVEAISALSGALEQQVVQKKQAAKEAKARADALRAEQQKAAQKRADDHAAEEARKQQAEKDAGIQRDADEEAERQRELAEKESASRILVEGIKLGGWIVLEKGEDTQRLKLAVRINASKKLVFVDRLGLNRHEFSQDQLISEVVAGHVRVLGGSAEFDDALSRVVGRIRVGKR